MGELYEKQEDGTLKPLEYPIEVVKRVNLFRWLKCQGLSLDEVKFIIQELTIT